MSWLIHYKSHGCWSVIDDNPFDTKEEANVFIEGLIDIEDVPDNIHPLMEYKAVEVVEEKMEVMKYSKWEDHYHLCPKCDFIWHWNIHSQSNCPKCCTKGKPGLVRWKRIRRFLFKPSTWISRWILSEFKESE